MYAFLPLRAVPYAAPYKKQKINVYKRRRNGLINFTINRLITLSSGRVPGLDQKSFLKLCAFEVFMARKGISVELGLKMVGLVLVCLEFLFRGAECAAGSFFSPYCRQ